MDPAATIDPNKCTEEQAAELLAPYADAFTNDAARQAVVALLMEDKAVGEDILRGLRGAEDSVLTREAAGEIVKKYAGCFSRHEAMLRVADLLVRDKEAGERLLSGLKKMPAGKAVALPPPPQHDPWQGPISPEQKAAAGAELITEIKKEGRFTDYSSAREEARRRRPDLFS